MRSATGGSGVFVYMIGGGINHSDLAQIIFGLYLQLKYVFLMSAGVAQSVERVALTQEHLKVAGSSPAFGSRFCYLFGFAAVSSSSLLYLSTKASNGYLEVLCALPIPDHL